MMLRLAYATGSWLALRSSLRLVWERRRRIGENSIYIPWFRRFRFWRARKGCCNRFGAF
jgi:hypothetical protein